MQPGADGAIDCQAQRMCRDPSPLCLDARIGQVKTRGIKRERTGIDDLPGDAVDIHFVKTDEASINSINPLVAICIDVAMPVRHHEGAPLADGEDGWANFYLD